MKKDDFRLRTFLQNVEKSQYRAIRRAIIDLCKVTKSSYYNWLNGVATPSPRRRTIINAVAVKYGEYCSPLPVYATLGQMYSWKYPFNIKRM